MVAKKRTKVKRKHNSRIRKSKPKAIKKKRKSNKPKRKKLTKKQLSESRKRGWKTRRKNEARLKAMKVEAKERWAKLHPEMAGLEEVIRDFVRKEYTEIESVIKSAAAVDMIEKYIKEGFFTESDESRWSARLLIANAEGYFWDEVERIAEEDEVSTSEVYHFWRSDMGML